MSKRTLHLACLVGLLTSCVLAVHAQTPDHASWDESDHRASMIGPVGGVNFAYISVDPDQGLDLRSYVRPVAGVATLLPIGGQKNQVQVELAYIGKGVKNMDGPVVETVSLDYLCLSPMLHLNVGRQPGFFLRIGPEVAWLLKSKFSCEVMGVRKWVDAKVAYSDFDLSLKGGAGVNLQATRRLMIQVNLTYTLGLIDILTGPGTGDDIYVTRGLQIQAGLLVPLRTR